MIFISGVHGVGKSYFCDMAKRSLGISAYPASKLIEERKHSGFSKDKLIPDIDVNQQYLLVAVDELRSKNTEFILDGHFCLLDAEGKVTRISLDVFTSLRPEVIILLTEKPEVIAKRRMERDSQNMTIESIIQFQNEEQFYAEEVAKLINAKLFISKGANDLSAAIEFLRSL